LLEPAIEGDIERRRLRRVLPEYRLEGGALFAVYPSAHHLTPKVRVFIDFLVEHLGARAGAREGLRAPAERCTRPSRSRT
jgi:DNA-binding transcriptional LysR family regulator